MWLDWMWLVWMWMWLERSLDPRIKACPCLCNQVMKVFPIKHFYLFFTSSLLVALSHQMWKKIQRDLSWFHFFTLGKPGILTGVAILLAIYIHCIYNWGKENKHSNKHFKRWYKETNICGIIKCKGKSSREWFMEEKKMDRPKDRHEEIQQRGFERSNTSADQQVAVWHYSCLSIALWQHIFYNCKNDNKIFIRND